MSRRGQFSSVRTEGGLLPQDLLSRIQSGDDKLAGLTAESYHLGPHERIGEAVNRAWSRLTMAWRSFEEALAHESEESLATGLTRERWLLPLFQELGYGRLPRGQAVEVEGMSFAVSHTWHRSPIHLLGSRVDLDRRQAGVAGAAKASPHGLVQELLNRSDDHLWGFVSNGLQLRVLRDHHSLTRQAYVEFDLQAMMRGEQYSDFLLLWLICHQSRVEADQPTDCWLESWVATSRDEGVRALDKLRGGVERAIQAFGTGFLKHKANEKLHVDLESGALDTQEYYREVLRLVYRLIFLFVAEEREALLDPRADDAAQSRYLKFYATRRLRGLAEKRRGGPHSDVWHRLRLVMSKLDDGCPEIALPALGSALWSSRACPTLMSAECSNDAALDAIRHLSNIQEQGTRYPVNWRNIGADELGSIYEGLLELHPRINRDAGAFDLDTAAGHERKTTGSYYTPAPLVDCLLDSALEPALDDAAKKPNPEQAILELKVCDPACGSGHFLVAAARRIAKRLAILRAGANEPSPQDIQRALRDVVGRCLYGIDVNPMAVELCKISLWLEAIEPGRPLSFLDSHIQCGNALLGATPALMAGGIPDDALKRIEGDDAGVARALRKRNKQERAAINDGQQAMFGDFDSAASRDFAAIGHRMSVIEAGSDDDIAALRIKEEQWGLLKRSDEFGDAWFCADAWCSSFVWPKQPGEPANAAITAGRWSDILADTTAVPSPTRRTVRELSHKYRFFHWHLAFPTVFAISGDTTVDTADLVTGWTGGFDVLLGNPPWDTLSPDVKEFFAYYEPAMRSLDADGQKEIMSRLLQDPAIEARWAQYRRELFAAAHFMKTSGRYTLFAAGNLGKGDFDVYRMFVETSLRTIRNGGRVAQVVPDGLYGGANCTAIRDELFRNFEFEWVLGFENRRHAWFKGIHGSKKFAIYSARRGGTTAEIRVAFGIRSVPELTAARSDALLSMPVHLVNKLSPEDLSVPEFASQWDIEIAEKMYALHPKFGDQIPGFPHRQYMREIDMGEDRSLFDDGVEGVPLYEGRMVAPYDHRAKGYRSGRSRGAVWVDLPFSSSTKSIQSQWYIPVEDIPDRVRRRCGQYRNGFCDVASPTNERTLVATVVPRDTLCGHKVPTIAFEDAPSWVYAVWLAVANSFAMDFLVRMKVSLTMSYTILDSMPFPRPTRDEAYVHRLVPYVLRLVCTDREMVDLWNLAAEDGWVPRHSDVGGVPGAIDEDERRRLQAKIDGEVAREVYGLTREELSHILDGFPIVKKRDWKRFGEYRTKSRVLRAYDEVGSEC